jgi:hypothetical protein
MANSVFQQLNGNLQPTQQNLQSDDMQAQFARFKQNPLQFLSQRNLNIPTEYQNDPRSAVNYLIQNGQMNGRAMQRLMGTLQRMGFKF